MATKAELIAHATELGLHVTEDQTNAEIAALIKQASSKPEQPAEPAPVPESEREPAPEPEPTPPAKPDAKTVPFDIERLSPEQLKQLKALLENTPSTANRGRRTVTVRKYKGQYVIGVKRCASKSVLDPIEQKAVTKITIPVLYYGADDFAVEDYKEFMMSERVKCEIVGQRQVEDDIIEGTVYSMELKKEVEQIVHTVVRFYTVKLPNGEEIELFEDSVNL